MSLVVLDPESFQRRQRALFVVPAAEISHAADQNNWAAVCAGLRVNALSCIKSAEHGWAGASFSCCEILAALHLHPSCSDISADNITLSKGHAAAMQYSCRFACGMISSQLLLSYKDGPCGGLEAHADIRMDTGSLGQCLSTCCAIACMNPSQRFAVVLGDGEMQEGQVYEALMTMRTRNICNLTVIVDVNKFQSDNLTHEIKLLPDFPQLFASFGFSVIEINGNDTSLVADAWCRSAGQLSVIIAHTTKAAGTHLMATEVNCAGKSCQPWHTRVPTWAVYRDFLNEQLASASSALKHLLDAHLLANLSSDHLLSLSNELRPKVAQVGTGKAFGEAIVRKLDEMPNLALLDGDLASSLGVTGASAHPRFFQMGVSEQDMCSFASGLAMSGLLPVVHTYSNFFKRSFENMFIANVDRLKIIYAGSYSGLCYHTDGPSHTSINDTSVMTGLGLVVLDPITPFHTTRLLEWSLSPSVSSSVFFRLRRTPLPEVSVFDEHVQQRDDTFSPARPIMINRSDCGTCRTCFIVMGTVGLFLALECVKMSEAFSKASISVVSALNVPLSDSDLESWKSLLSSFSTFICIEDDAGALYRHVCHMCVQHVASSPPKVLSKRIERPGPSCRTFGACLEYHGFTVAGIEALCV